MQKETNPATTHSESNRALLGNTAAAQYIGIEPGTLEVWRSTKRYVIPYIRSGRLIKYRKIDLDTWLQSRTVGATA